MLELRTVVSLPRAVPPMAHHQPMLCLGSCFATEIGNLLAAYKFEVDTNPFGTLYNPLSIAAALQRLLLNKPFTADELFQHNGLWRSFMHHGSFAAPTPDACLANINARYLSAAAALPHTTWLVITLGTAYVYRHAQRGTVVANCHKLPEHTFERLRLSVDDITQCYLPLIAQLRANSPQLRILFTVSPIRHLRDGLHANQISKATLLLAVDALCTQFPETVFYFPSYEICIDELRDYRFYADDMAHPSALAVRYVWEKFSQTMFSKTTQSLMHTIESVARDVAHRPLHPHSPAYQHFVEQLIAKIEKLKKAHPYIDFTPELALCHTASTK